jgi:hypothetical protein
VPLLDWRLSHSLRPGTDLRYKGQPIWCCPYPFPSC